MESFSVEELRRAQASGRAPYHEFLRHPSVSVGLYVLPAGGVDQQLPHSEDEVYHVLAGRGRLRVADEDTAVEAGSIVYVAADVDHRFHDITEELAILVVFAPAEYSRREQR